MRIGEYTENGMVYRDSTPEEDAEQGPEEISVPARTQEERIAELEAQNQMLTQCLMEMSQIVYA